eukprot:964367-Rhodomonas_salina.1
MVMLSLFVDALPPFVVALLLYIAAMPLYMAGLHPQTLVRIGTLGAFQVSVSVYGDLVSVYGCIASIYGDTVPVYGYTTSIYGSTASVFGVAVSVHGGTVPAHARQHEQPPARRGTYGVCGTGTAYGAVLGPRVMLCAVPGARMV